MTNCLLGLTNPLTSATLTAGAELSNQSAANLADDQGAARWVTPGGVVTAADGAYVDIDFGVAATLRGFGVFRTNLTADAEVTFTLGSSAGASDVYSSGALDGVAAGYLQLVHDAGADYSARYARIAIDDAANPDGQIAIGLAFVGPLVEISRNFSFGWGLGRAGAPSILATRGGQEYPTVQAVRRTLDLRFDFLSEADVYDIVHELDRLSRLGGNHLVIPRPDSDRVQRETVFGRVTAGAAVVQPNYDIFSFPFQVSERL